MKSNFIELPEGRLHVITAGEQGDAVILLSGAGLDNALVSWRYLIPVLAEKYCVFALDWPKQGKSTPWKTIADHDCLMKCVDTVVEHFQLDKIRLVGLSMGGGVAMAYAIKYPERVRSFVAVAPAGILQYRPGEHQFFWLLFKSQKLVSWILGFLFKNEKFARKSLNLFFDKMPDDVDAVYEEILQEAEINGVSTSDWQNKAIGFLKMKIDFTPDLHKIKCPALFIHGDKDKAIHHKFSRRAVELIESAELVELKNHGHWPNRQSPERVNKLIADFLEKS